MTMKDQNVLKLPKNRQTFFSNGQGFADSFFLAVNRCLDIRRVANTSPKNFEVNTWIRNLNFKKN